MTLHEQIDDFFSQRTLAIVGASRNEKDFSRLLMREFQKKGYMVMPVNPKGGMASDLRCYATVKEIPVPVDAALLILPPTAYSQAVNDCAEAGVKRLWIYGVGQPQKLDEAAQAACREHRVSVINGYCPLMFLAGAAWPHRVHGWILKTFQHSRFELQAQ